MRHAFTLVELLVTIAIIGVLIGLASPAVQAMRESSRRTVCQSRLIPIGMALQSYHGRWLQYPVGTIAESGPVESVASGQHHNWLGRLMDSLDQPVIAKRIDRTLNVYDEANAPVMRLSFPGVRCPSAGRSSLNNASSYVGLHHSSEKPIDASDNGVFLLNTVITQDDVTDGLSNTAFVSEKIVQFDDLGWLSGTRATLRNVGGGIQSSAPFASPVPTVVGSVGSQHPGGVNVLFGSGENRFMSDQTDQRILVQMADRQDGQLPLQYQSIESQRLQSVQ